MTLAVASVILVALAFDFVNGFHDAANSIATVVSTRVLSPRYAVVWAAFFNFIAFLVFETHVASTIGKGVIDAHVIDTPVVFAALVGGIVWDLITWWFGIPSSSSHALIGGLAGAGVAKAGAGVLETAGLTKIGVSIVLSPLLGLVLGFNDAGVLDVPALHAHAGGHALPPRAARVGGALQPGPRRQRRPEDDGRHRRPALRQRNAR